MNLSYIATNIDELINQASPEIQGMLSSGEINSVTATLGKIYKLPMTSYVPLSNIISFILIGALQPSDVMRALEEILKMSPDDARNLAGDLDKSILEKARISILGKGTNPEIKTLVFEGVRSPDELRKEILDNTNREAVKPNNPNPNPQAKKTTVLTPGSRSQLLEQLQLIGSIPKDEEVDARLNHIKEQINKIDAEKKEGENTLDNNVTLENYMFGDDGNKVVDAKLKSASYSKAPTKYNVDPYREVAEEV
ncbi:MAG: hypothetical protein JWN37_156 [Candidatus Nomurabacteria bacterium]|nr:hypothetical protein [Candidatus Nomurabacteria bacterium]